MKQITEPKRSITLVLLIVSGIALSACADEFLTRLPQDEISNTTYWSSPQDLQLYVNQFYEALPTTAGYDSPFYKDWASDNLAGYWRFPDQPNPRLAGFNTINSGNGIWNTWYGRIRDVNFMLAQARKMGALSEEGKRYVGEARFFRAYFYYQLLKAYGAVPWISKPLDTESEELFAPRTPRDQVVDSILVDLDYAIAHLPPKSQTGSHRLNKESALLFKSRVALYEGTWEKYHQRTPSGVEGSNGRKYLEVAAQAAKTLIDMGTASLYSTGHPYSDYFNLFNRTDLSGNPEVLLWKEYSVSLGLSHSFQRWVNRNGGGTGVTKSLVDVYLAIDGEPIAVSPLYQGDATLQDVVANRDPRLHQIIWIPGDVFYIYPDGSVSLFERTALYLTGNDQCTTGYQLKKGGAQDPNMIPPGTGVTASIVFRYAEALLNYAEARAELSVITQADLDMTINKLRDRVDMSHLMLGSITPDSNWNFPNLPPIINEIRRERRVELAVEGFRTDDIFRWAAADELIIGKHALGAQFNQSKFPDMVVGEDIYVNEDGYIDVYQKVLPNGYGFDPSRDYLLPIPSEQITLNQNLTQNPGW